MSKELDLWLFVRDRLGIGQVVVLLVVTESSGSSPGRAGYKMAVGADGKLAGSIGGGVMEVSLVERSRSILAGVTATKEPSQPASLVEQVHRTGQPNASGMICSGRQAVVIYVLTSTDAEAVEAIVDNIEHTSETEITLTQNSFAAAKSQDHETGIVLKHRQDGDFEYREVLGVMNGLYIVGGGHCALALSELMSRLDFRIRIFDDRPDLNTIEKNRFAHEITILDGYDQIGPLIPAGEHTYVVVMTLGFQSDAAVIRSLVDKQIKYFGVLGSRAKMSTLLRELEAEGIVRERLDRIRTPIGIPISSRTPDEIAISIAAEIISIKNL